MPNVSQYKVGRVKSVEACVGNNSKGGGGGGGGGNKLKACLVEIDPDGTTITVVTAAANVREGSRLAVAPVGSTVLNDDGDEMPVQKMSVGGVMSEGMFCDSAMLGWSGGASGIAAQMPDSLPVGSAPPTSKPRPAAGGEPQELAAPIAQVPGLFEKKLTKEEKKRLAEEKRKARKAAKEAKQAEGDGDDT